MAQPVCIPDILARTVERSPDALACDFFGSGLRYSRLEQKVEAVAASLQQMGLKPGDRLALCLPNTPFYLIIYHAVLRIGGVAVAVNPLYSEHEIEHLLKDSGARFAATVDEKEICEKVDDACRESGVEKLIVCSIAQALPWPKSVAYRLLHFGKQYSVADDGRHVTFDDLVQNPAPCTPHICKSDDLAVLQYTGGTTGRPKGAMLSHGNLVANVLQMHDHDSACPDEPEVVLGILPMFHVFALTTVLNYSALTGGQIVLLPRFEAKGFCAAFARTRPQRLFLVPTLVGKMIDMIKSGELKGLDRVRSCISGGAPLPVDMIQEFQRVAGFMPVEGYGLTEASPIIACNGIVSDRKAGSVGRPFPGTRISIRSLDDPSVEMPQGEPGEVCAAGPQVMQGYWKRDDATSKVMVGEFLRTGDVGYIDADGYLFLVDRIKDLIICGGYNVYPRVIEEALYEHGAVREAVVIGVPDDYRGEAPKAFVTLNPGERVTEEQLKTFLGERISKIEMPREIEFRDELPKTLIGKLSKKELRQE